MAAGPASVPVNEHGCNRMVKYSDIDSFLCLIGSLPHSRQISKALYLEDKLLDYQYSPIGALEPRQSDKNEALNPTRWPVRKEK